MIKLVLSLLAINIFINCASAPISNSNANEEILKKYEKREKDYKAKKKEDKNNEILYAVAVGDSWFDYPAPNRKDVIDYMIAGEFKTNEKKIFDYQIISVAKAGVKLEDMFLRVDFLKEIKEDKPNIFLLSGGGNDLLSPDFLESIILWDKDNKSDNPEDYINKNILNSKLENLEWWIGKVISTLETARIDIKYEKPIPTFMHGYSYIITDENHPCSYKWLRKLHGKKCEWVRPVLVGKDAREKPQNPDKLYSGIARYIIQRYNELLLKIQEKNKGKFYYVDLRKESGKWEGEGVGNKLENWDDEIHLEPNEYKKIANAFHATILQALAGKGSNRNQSNVKKAN